MNLPTKITVARLVLTVFIIVLLCIPYSFLGISVPEFDVNGVVIELHYIIAGVIFIIASLTDFLDGYLARKNNQVTDTGKMLDAIADKALVNPILIILAACDMLAPWKGISVIIPVIIITRDIIVDAIKMEAASKGKVVAAIKSGKLKTAAMMTGVSLVFFHNIPFEFINIRVDLGLIYFACIMSIVSACQYITLNKHIIFPKKENTK